MGAAACTSGEPGSEERAGTTTTPLPAPALSDNPFALGVASGDPTSDAVILWTRLLVPAGIGSVPVAWAMADESGATVAEGTAVAEPRHGHAVHVDARDLRAGSRYTYQFTVGRHESAVGSTRTTPEATAREPLRLAVMNCQAYQTGFYSAYRHVAGRPVDLGFFVGDYIYELEPSIEARPHGMTPPQDLESYRRFYEVNKRDADLQAAHAAFPWVVTWDDHEVEDNYASLEPGAIGRAADPDADSKFAAKRAAAYQAWWEHMPVRLPPPDQGSIRIHRSFDWGEVARFMVLDNRQYRSSIPSGEGAGNLPRGAGGGPQLPAAFDEDATYLGRDQEQWLEGQLSDSPATWNVLVQQTVMAEFDRAPGDPERGFSMDSWDGYVAARRRLLDFVASAGVGNLVSVGGDIHSSAVNDLKADYRDSASPVLGTEFIAPSITALERLPEGFVEGGRSNPHVHYYDVERHGWLGAEITPEAFRAGYHYVSSITDPNASVDPGPSWTISAGTVGVRPD